MTDEKNTMSDEKIETFFSKLRRLDVEARVNNNTDWMNFDCRVEWLDGHPDTQATAHN
ncbi:hypothetical protein [Pontibaca salina]|uniref:Uncharacterized protein n=1 Tax=Pontibaca salina TaxID=2795731 RepID=A0A934HU35_9RHOB|nr:hypothetical protein [Pontibaca salina]MBI6630800.1 hypothetical protein [Pontibaca salina]